MENTARNFFKHFTILLSICFIFGPGFTFANEPPAMMYHPAITTSPMSSIGDSSAEYESQIIAKESATYHIAVRFPEIVSASIPEAKRDEVNSAIRQFVDKISEEDIRSFTEDGIDPEADDSLGVLKNEIDIRFEIVNLDPHFVSIKFERYFYGAGAAHGVSAWHGFNYSFDSGRVFKLSNLFETGSNYLEQISTLAIEDLERQARSDLSKYSDDVDEEWIKAGATSTEQSLSEFAFNGSTLTIYFGQYQVGCGAFGARETKISSFDLKGLKKNIVAYSTETRIDV